MRFQNLPANNFKFGQHSGAALIGKDAYRVLFDKGYDGCWMGCTVACANGVRDFVPITGPYQGKRVFVDGPEYETIAGCGSNLGIFDPFTILEMSFYCDAYGLDTISVGTSLAFAMECFEMGLINETHTKMDLSFGNRTSALTILHQMAGQKGFGKVVGQGIRRMKSIFEKEYGAEAAIMQDIGMESKGLEFSGYMTSVYNFQRIFNLKMGFGQREHDNIPYRAIGPVTIEEYESRQERYDRHLIEKANVDITGKSTLEKLTLLRNYREEAYEKLKDAVYRRRGWTRNGVPTLETVKRLHIDFPEVVELLKRHQAPHSN
jgi:aldehyde:ferredoxin oxidoreductase